MFGRNPMPFPSQPPDGRTGAGRRQRKRALERLQRQHAQQQGQPPGPQPSGQHRGVTPAQKTIADFHANGTPLRIQTHTHWVALPPDAQQQGQPPGPQPFGPKKHSPKKHSAEKHSPLIPLLKKHSPLSKGPLSESDPIHTGWRSRPTRVTPPSPERNAPRPGRTSDTRSPSTSHRDCSPPTSSRTPFRECQSRAPEAAPEALWNQKRPPPEGALPQTGVDHAAPPIEV